MVFERPLLLLLLPVVLLALGLVARWSLAHWSRRRTLITLAVRGLIAALVVIAIAGPRWLGSTREARVVFLKDVSASIDPAELRRADDLVTKAREGHERVSNEVSFARAPQAAPSPAPNPDETDLSAALDFAGALLPADYPGRIVLLSDGNWNAGRDPLIAAAALRQRGIEVDVLPLRRSEEPDAAVSALQAPPHVREGDLFDLTAEVLSTAALPGARVRLFQNNLLVGEVSRDLTPGVSSLVFPNIRAEGGAGLYEVEVTAPGDSRLENNRRKMAIVHGGAARTLIVDREPGQSEPLARVLRGAGFAVETRPPEGLPASLAELENFDLIILADAPAAELRDEQFRGLDAWVKDFGGGFLMTGGENSFGAGGFFRTPVAGLLPVRIERDEREESPVVALLVILDRSGSMTASVGDRTKMALANEGGALALEVLQSKDLFGLFAVDTRVQEVVPLAPAVDKAAAARKIAAVTAGGGGIYIYTSLAEALPRLRDVQAKIKHIILFSDAADAEEKVSGAAEGGSGLAGGSALDLASAMLASRITLSVVALGNEEDKDTAFLRDLASRGGGRFYLTADATTLPRLFTQETMRASQSSLREDAFFAHPPIASDVTRGLEWADSPPLLGLNVASPKPGAEVLLTAESGEPLLTVWRYGLGQAGAFLSDARARWASEWLDWPGYGKFWVQLARRLARPDRRDDLTAAVREEGDKLAVDIEAVTPEGQFRNGLPVTITIAESGGASRTIPARQTEPGHYRAVLDRPTSGLTVLAVGDGSGRPVSLAWTQNAPREYFATEDGTPLLRSLVGATGGLFAPEPAQFFRPAAQPRDTRHDLSAWFLGLALLLWPVDIWLRRRDWPAA